MHNIYLKSQKIIDLKTSYKWRNDKSIWTKTVGEGKFKSKKISHKDEIEWFNRIKKKKDRKNLSIFLQNNKLIGNIYFTNILNRRAEFQIVIGDKKYWNKGLGYKSTKLSLTFANVNFNINEFYLFVKKDNIFAIKIYKKIGFRIIKSNLKEIIKMSYKSL
jgi:RimJ/RimL family protein N-acetyltransferase|tara:strand:- start:1897 stop:2379 length:483 start_codon:yes stop_codon:yes gene_type:complete